MKKEVLIAIIAGFSLGLVITFGIHTAQKSIKEKISPTPPTTQTQSSANEASSHTLSITQPLPNTISATDTITIVGTTTPGSLIAAIGLETQETTEADSDGTFNLSLQLEPGPNTVTVISFDPSGEKAEVTFDIAFSSVDINPSPSPNPSPKTP